MDLISILATVILATTIGTLIVGVGAYAAFKLRDSRKPKAKINDDTSSSSVTKDPIFLKRYIPNIVQKQPSE